MDYTNIKKLSTDQEKQLVEEYRKGAPVIDLMARYGYKTKKSITDKVKKYYPQEYQNIIKEAHDNRRGYIYSLERITNQFDGYLIGLLLTDGYILSDRDGFGLDLIDEDCIKYIAESIGTNYKSYEQSGNKQTKFRVLVNLPGISKQLERFGIIKNKTYTILAPQLFEDEKRFIPYIIRGIIDGDGCVSPTSYGGAQFYIASMSKIFIEWIKSALEENLYMSDLHIHHYESGIYRIETADQCNILKLIAICYDKPFGMMRKYNLLRQTFRDYNKNLFNT